MFKEYKGYKIYEDGRVISPKGRQIGSKSPNGYVRVTIKGEKWSVHRLVMNLFVGPSNLTVNHKNEIKNDNRLSNLEYDTIGDNIRKYWSNNEHPGFGKYNGLPVNDIRDSKLSSRVLAKMYNTSRGTIQRIKKETI
jgi:hypothetical protein